MKYKDVVCVKMDRALLARVDRFAKMMGITRSEIIRRALETYIGYLEENPEVVLEQVARHRYRG